MCSHRSSVELTQDVLQNRGDVSHCILHWDDSSLEMSPDSEYVKRVKLKMTRLSGTAGSISIMSASLGRAVLSLHLTHSQRHFILSCFLFLIG
jgi:hypothetical protein